MEVKKCPVCKTNSNKYASCCDKCGHELSYNDIYISKYGRTTIRNSEEFTENLYGEGVILLCSIPDFDENLYIQSPFPKKTPMVIKFLYDMFRGLNFFDKNSF